MADCEVVQNKGVNGVVPLVVCSALQVQRAFGSERQVQTKRKGSGGHPSRENSEATRCHTFVCNKFLTPAMLDDAAHLASRSMVSRLHTKACDLAKPVSKHAALSNVESQIATVGAEHIAIQFFSFRGPTHKAHVLTCWAYGTSVRVSTEWPSHGARARY